MTTATSPATYIGGRHPETAGLRNLLAGLGVRAPHTGEPFTEAMLLGIGGGVGAGYFTFEFGKIPTLMIGTRHSWEYSDRFLAGICERIGAPLKFKETRSAGTALKNLNGALAEGRSVLAWVDLAGMPYALLPSYLQCYYYHVVRVTGLDGDDVLVDDRAPALWRVPRPAFEAARMAIRSAKARLLLVDAPPGPVDLAAAVDAGLAACYRYLTEPPIKNFGLPALAKWSELVASTKDKKSWSAVFPPGVYLYRALSNTYGFIETAGTGGALRPLFADFLEEASSALDRPALAELARHYRDLGAEWSALATAALPDSVPLLREAREQMLRKSTLLAERGPEALDEMRAAQDRLDALEAEAASSFPMTKAEIADLFADLSTRIRAIYEGECAAAAGLRA